MGYSSMMFSRAAMDVAIPLILQDEATGIGPRDIGTLLTLCSFFYLFGKISMGYSVDQVGPRFVFLGLASFASAGLTCLISFSTTASRMTILMCLLCVAQSSGWAAMTSMVSLWLQPSQYAMAFGILSTSSRMGDLASKIVLGQAVAQGWAWRSLFMVAAALQLVVAFVNLALMPKHPSASTEREGRRIVELKPQRPHRGDSFGIAHGAGFLEESGPLLDTSSPSSSSSSSGSMSLTHIWAIARTPRFTSMAVAIAALHIVMEFDKYIPLYLHRSLDLSPGLAAQGAALYPFSQLVALGIAGIGYDRLSPRGRLYTITGLCLAVAWFYGLQLLLLLASSSPMVAHQNIYFTLIFLAGFSVAVPYYLPPSIYLAEVGGKGKCGTLSGVLDASGGLTSMGFHYGVGHLVSRGRWGVLLGVLSVCSLLGCLAMAMFHSLSLGGRGGRWNQHQHQHQQQQQQQQQQQNKKKDLFVLGEDRPASALSPWRVTPSHSFRSSSSSISSSISSSTSSSSAGASHHYHQPQQQKMGVSSPASALSRLPLIGGVVHLGWSLMGRMGGGKPGVGMTIERKRDRKDSNEGGYEKHLLPV